MIPKITNRMNPGDSNEAHSSNDSPGPLRKSSDSSVKINASWISILHTLFASSLVVGYKLHFYKIVKNEHYAYPEEWFPSVSSTIGDWYPERNIFHTLIALTCPPRLMLLFTWYFACTTPKFSQGKTRYPTILFAVGFLRTLTCGGWVYVTSSDDHDIHDIAMISYMVLTIPYMIMTIGSGSRLTLLSRADVSLSNKVSFYRKITSISFFAVIVPMAYYFLQHKVSHVAGAYTIYAFHEWALIFLDILFDSFSYYEFQFVDYAISPNQNGHSSNLPNRSSGTERLYSD
ncbi:Protein CWH43 [Smittium mucronatum]|uniref:Protein CWH43 n=1 Tax=Smittium mucronatum TaxID=133383 RepID=A0A1R0GVK4_9FUNG|nr:Protein CWH43 [Smittium mucronatum]